MKLFGEFMFKFMSVEYMFKVGLNVNLFYEEVDLFEFFNFLGCKLWEDMLRVS